MMNIIYVCMEFRDEPILLFAHLFFFLANLSAYYAQFCSKFSYIVSYSTVISYT